MTMLGRFDIAGGWSDAPPFYPKNWGAVINVQLPQFGVLVEPASADEYESNVIIDACYKVLGMANDRSLKLVNTIPRRSGLGGSSIIAGAVIRAIAPEIQNSELIRRVLEVEEEIGTFGGWQDIIGGLYPGIKLTLYNPASGGFNIKMIDDSVLLRDFLGRCLLIDTGQRRQEKSHIMEKYAKGDSSAAQAIEQARRTAIKCWNFLMDGNYYSFAGLMEYTWRQVCEVEEIEPPILKEEGLLGYKTGGAGGGGFILAIYENRPENPNLSEHWRYWKL